ncbi:MAG: DUF2627 family protein, partial [Clostridia bacterium]
LIPILMTAGGIKLMRDTLFSRLAESLPYLWLQFVIGVLLFLAGFLFLFFRHKIKGDGISKNEIKTSPSVHHSSYIIKRLIRIAIPVCVGAIAFNITSLIDLTSIMFRLKSIMETDPLALINMCGIENLAAKGIIIPENLALLTPELIEKVANYVYGSYQFTVSLFNLVPAITTTFGMSVLPTISSCWALKDYKAVKFNINVLLRMCSLVALPAGIGLSMMSSPVLKLLYSSSAGEIAIAAPILTITSITAIFLAVVTPLYSVLQGIGRADIPVIFMVIGGILKVIINFALVGVPQINIYGAAIGTFVCYSFIFISSLIAVCKITKTKPDIIGVLIKPLIAALACGIISIISYNIISNFISSKFICVIAIGFGGVVYLTVLLLTKALKKSDVLMFPKGEKISKFLEKHNLLS